MSEVFSITGFVEIFNKINSRVSCNMFTFNMPLNKESLNKKKKKRSGVGKREGEGKKKSGGEEGGMEGMDRREKVTLRPSFYLTLEVKL